MVDLHASLLAVMALASACASAALPFLVPAVLKLLRVQLTAAQSAMVTAAAARGAGLAYAWLVSTGAAYAQVDIRNVAVAKGVGYVTARVPELLGAFGLTPDHVASMVTGELGKLLAADPTITLGNAAPVGTPAAAPLPPTTSAQAA